MDFLKAFLVFTVFWQQIVFGRPSRRTPRASKDCNPNAKLKQEYSNSLQIMVENMRELFRLTKSTQPQPTISFPPSYLVSINTNTKTMDRLDAYFKEMDKYTAYLSPTGSVSVLHGNLLQAIKNVGTSVENYCNCPPTGKQHFVSTTPSTPVKSLTKKDVQFVNYKIRISLHEIYNKHSSTSPILC